MCDGDFDRGECNASDYYVQRDADYRAAGVHADAEECGNGSGGGCGVCDVAVDDGVVDCDWGNGVVGFDGL